MWDDIFNWRFAVKTLGWGTAMLGVLQIRHLSGDWSHALCGPWGCGPTLESVVTCHALWIVLLMPALLLIARRLPRAAVAVCGWVAIALGLAGLLAVAGWVGAVWYPQTDSVQRSYAVQKYLYTVACLVDFPMVQLTAMGAVLKFIGRSPAAGEGLLPPATAPSP